MFEQIFRRYSYIKNIVKYIDGINNEIDTLRSKIDMDSNCLNIYYEIRNSIAYQSVYECESPLVSVCVGTYNRCELLIERSLKSILNQDYRNLEIIVVGDYCTDDTAIQISKIKDKRLKFVNLPMRGEYPKDPMLRWMVAGTATVNHALSLATGDFITHLDDDDEFLEGRISTLVDYIKKTKADFIWHPFWRESASGRWRINDAKRFAKNHVTTSSVFYHNWFKCIPWDVNAYQHREPGDWNRFRKIMYLGAKTVRYPEPLIRHYKERSQKST